MTSIFSKIISRDIPADIVYEDEKVIAIKDTNPVAPIHFLVITKTPYISIVDMPNHESVYITAAIKKLANEHGLEDSGFRVITNSGADGGQTVPHLHFHLIGGKTLSHSLA